MSASATEIMLAMIASAIASSIEPNYFVTSKRLSKAYGWDKIMRNSDQGTPFFLGMQVRYVDKNIICMGVNPVDQTSINTAQELKIINVDGEVRVVAKP